ncbi:MAG: ATP cone domain-containing protein [Patescibacteria group bacterium]
MNENIKVLKRDGSLENFNQEKIHLVTKAAGLTEEQAKNLTKKAVDWVFSTGKSTVSSLDIRLKVAAMLKEISEYSAGLYEWYEKTKKK